MKSISFIKNSFLMYFRMLFVMFITLFVARLSLNYLGVDGFGLYSVIASFIVMGGFITGALSSAGQRFLSEHMNSPDLLNKTFQTCNYLNMGVSVLLLFSVGSFGILYIVYFLNSPLVPISTVLIVFSISLATFFINLLFTSLFSFLMAEENVAVFSVVTFSEVCLKLFFVYFVYLFPFEKIISYSLALLLPSMIVRASMLMYFYCSYKYLSLKPKWYSQVGSKIMKFISWSALGGLANVVNTQGVNLLINLFFSLTVSASRAISLQIFSALSQLISSVQMAISPKIVQSYVSEDFQQVQSYFNVGAKITFFVTLVVVCLIHTNIESLLTLWLDDYPRDTIIFTQITLIEIVILSFCAPILSVIQASGDIKKYQLTVGLILLLTIPLCYFTLHFYNQALSIYVVLVISSIIGACVRMYFLYKLTSFSLLFDLLKIIAKGIVVFIIYKAVSLKLHDIYILRDNVIVVLFLDFISVSLITFIFAFNRREKYQLLLRLRVRF